MRLAFTRLGPFVWGSLLSLALLAPLGCNNDAGGGTQCPAGGICTTGNPDLAGSGSCVENWVCSPWTTAGGGSNQGSRTCVDKNLCGTTQLKPAETATLPALDMEYFKCNVEPIFDNKCSMLGCHGTETDRALRIYSRGRLRNLETVTETGCLAAGKQVQLVPTCVGSIECICWTGSHTQTEWQRNFDSARAFGLDAQNQPIPAGMEDSSDLLAQPVVGGKAHSNIHLFDRGDTEYTTLKQWLAGAKLGATCNTVN